MCIPPCTQFKMATSSMIMHHDTKQSWFHGDEKWSSLGIPVTNHIIIEVIVFFCYFLPVFHVKLSFFLHIYTHRLTHSSPCFLFSWSFCSRRPYWDHPHLQFYGESNISNQKFSPTHDCSYLQIFSQYSQYKISIFPSCLNISCYGWWHDWMAIDEYRFF